MRWLRTDRWLGHDLLIGDCDVLIIGGGFAGLMAARAAAPQVGRTLVVAKGFAGADGVSAFAGGIVVYLLPEDDWDGFLAEHARHSEGLAHPEAVRQVVATAARLLTDLARTGAPLERAASGQLVRRRLPVAGRRSVPRLGFESVGLARCLRQLAIRAGARFLDQTVITALRRGADGTFWAVGCQRQQGGLVAIRARAVVLAAGGCSWRGAHMGQHNVMGDACALALEAGADLAGMEFCSSYLATCALFDTHGQCVLAALGGRLRNRLGEDILARYGFDQPAATHQVALAMLAELAAGRGPITFDLTGIPPASRQDWEAHFALVSRGLRRLGRDVFRDPVPWLPGFTGSIAGGGGVRTRSLAGDTVVPGLFVAGDAAVRVPVVGAGSGITFLNVAWALASGHWAGLAAGRWASPSAAAPDREALAQALQATLAPLADQPVGDPGALLRALQRLVVDPQINFFRTAAGLEAATEQLRALWPAIAAARAVDWHGLVRLHELRSAALTAMAGFQSARARSETRGWHRRQDHPDRDPGLDDVWSVARLADPADHPGDFTITFQRLTDPAVFSPRPPEEAS